jgi:hypothetical protein
MPKFIANYVTSDGYKGEFSFSCMHERDAVRFALLLEFRDRIHPDLTEKLSVFMIGQFHRERYNYSADSPTWHCTGSVRPLHNSSSVP